MARNSNNLCGHLEVIALKKSKTLDLVAAGLEERDAEAKLASEEKERKNSLKLEFTEEGFNLDV